MSTNGNGNGRLLSLGGGSNKAKDAFGRVLAHNATVEDVYKIIAEEVTKVHEFYLNQLPPYVANMIQDALLSFGLIKMDPAVEAGLVQSAIATAESTGDAIPASGDTLEGDRDGTIETGDGQYETEAPSAANVPTDSEGPEAA